MPSNCRYATGTDYYRRYLVPPAASQLPKQAHTRALINHAQHLAVAGSVVMWRHTAAKQKQSTSTVEKHSPIAQLSRGRYQHWLYIAKQGLGCAGNKHWYMGPSNTHAHCCGLHHSPTLLHQKCMYINPAGAKRLQEPCATSQHSLVRSPAHGRQFKNTMGHNTLPMQQSEPDML